MPDVQLREREARLVYLATVYHLGRPGSELDPLTRQPHGLGLAPVHELLRTHLEGAPAHAAVTLALSEYQLGRLGEALLGLVNELKQVGLSGRSVVPGLIEALARVVPGEVSEVDAGAAIDLAGEVTLLHRRLGSALREADTALEGARAEQSEAAALARPWWKIWAR